MNREEGAGSSGGLAVGPPSGRPPRAKKPVVCIKPRRVVAKPPAKPPPRRVVRSRGAGGCCSSGGELAGGVPLLFLQQISSCCASLLKPWMHLVELLCRADGHVPTRGGPAGRAAHLTEVSSFILKLGGGERGEEGGEIWWERAAVA